LRAVGPFVFRLIRPDDNELMLDGLARMSAESRFRRFFSHRERLSASELAYLTELDHERHFAIAAGRPAIGVAGMEVEVGLVVARFVELDDPTGHGPRAAEAAIAVVDDAQGLGLGRMLFERLVMAAAERGIAVFRFDVLAENDTMLGLVKTLFPSASSHVDVGIMTIDCPIPDFVTHDPGEQPPEDLNRMPPRPAGRAVKQFHSAA